MKTLAAGARSWRHVRVRAQRGEAAVRHRLDLFGILVLSFAAANFGGIARDLLIGAVPPAAISDWRYIAVSLLAGLGYFSSTRPLPGCDAQCLSSTARDWRSSRSRAH